MTVRNCRPHNKRHITRLRYQRNPSERAGLSSQIYETPAKHHISVLIMRQWFLDQSDIVPNNISEKAYNVRNVSSDVTVILEDQE